MKPKFLITGIILVVFGLGLALWPRREEIPVFFPILRSSLSKEEISPSQLAKRLKNKDFTFINVHVPYEGEIERTDLFISYNEIVANAATLPKDKNAPIVLYCQSGRMSAEALGTLKKLGYQNVVHLKGGMVEWKKQGHKVLDLSKLETEVIPESGAQLPVAWGNLGPRLVETGVIDLEKFKKYVLLTAEQESILTKESPEFIKIDRKNVQFVVDVLWAAGLAQKSVVYDEGPMGKEYKDNAGGFASTGGWNLAVGDAMQYYNKFDLLELSPEQQKRTAEIAKNIYRPCCGNSTYFPDCNHGMAALFMIELMVKNGANDNTIYRKLLEFNSYWFSDTYLTTATYFARQGVNWESVDPKRVMSAEFSSGQGARAIAQKVGTLPWRTRTGTSCGA